jgi:hypothetical protein
LNAFKDDIPESDSLYEHFGRVPLSHPFLPTQSAYHNLKDVGIGIISNDSLRSSILKRYESGYVFLQKLADSQWDNINSRLQQPLSRKI